MVLYPGVLVLLAQPRTRTLAVTLLAALSVPFTTVAVSDARTPPAVVATLLLPATLLPLGRAVRRRDENGAEVVSTTEDQRRIKPAPALDT